MSIIDDAVSDAKNIAETLPTDLGDTMRAASKRMMILADTMEEKQKDNPGSLVEFGDVDMTDVYVLAKKMSQLYGSAARLGETIELHSMIHQNLFSELNK